MCQLNAARNAFQTEKSIWRFSWSTEPVRRTQDWIDLDLGEMEQLARRFVKARIDFTERYAWDGSDSTCIFGIARDWDCQERPSMFAQASIAHTNQFRLIEHYDFSLWRHLKRNNESDVMSLSASTRGAFQLPSSLIIRRFPTFSSSCASVLTESVRINFPSSAINNKGKSFRSLQIVIIIMWASWADGAFKAAKTER